MPVTQAVTGDPEAGGIIRSGQTTCVLLRVLDPLGCCVSAYQIGCADSDMAQIDRAVF